METSRLSCEKSLLVPSVQELAKEGVQDVPSRYVRPDIELLAVPASASLQSIPVIDFDKLLDGNSMDSELQTLNLACQEWGFFQLINHGVSNTLIEKMKGAVVEFFNLPMEEKKKFCQKDNEMEGFGQLFVVSEEQKLDWADIFFLRTLPPSQRKPHLFPHLPPFFKTVLEEYAVELEKLAKTVVSLMGQALKMEGEEMNEWFDSGTQSMRMNYYPPCPQPEKVIGLTPHSDSVGLTLLLQINEIEGLQIKKDGNWISVKPLPNAFIVNLGDILEILSNGIYRRVEHRAVINSAKERLSVATFYSPNIESVIEPAPSILNEQMPARFKKVATRKYFRDLFSRELDGKSYLDLLRIWVPHKTNIV